MYELRCQMVAPVSILEAFEVFENPYNLARITPPWLNFRVTSKENVRMREGARIDYAIRWMRLPLRWRTLITEYEPPNSFVDEQEKGPYTRWRHRHTFTEALGGTLVEDVVRYSLPLGLLGVAAHDMVVGRQLRRIFEFRQEALRAIWGGGEVTPPSISVR